MLNHLNPNGCVVLYHFGNPLNILSALESVFADRHSHYAQSCGVLLERQGVNPDAGSRLFEGAVVGAVY